MKKNTLQAKKVLLALFAILIPLLTSCQQEQQDDTVNQEEEKSPGIDYLFDINNRTAKVLGFIGDYPASIDIPSTTDYEGIDYRVTGIGDYAFSGYSNLTAIAIPEEVITIGLAAFENCSNLSSITCRATTPPTIQSNTFYGVDNSTPVHVPEGSVKSYQSAKYWKEFTNIRPILEGTCGDNLTWKLTDRCELIIEGIGAMDDFPEYKAPWSAHCSLIQDISIKEGVTSIGKFAFYKCENLKSITIPEGVTSIGNSAFRYCSSLTAINIPEGVTSIGDYAFSSCSNITDINIPESVTSIGNYAFCDCRSLTDINIPASVTSIGYGVFSGCSSLTTITIPKNVTSIGEWAFRYCSSLTAITIPEGVTSIRGQAFSGCSSLTTITIPESVTSIGNYAFRDCSSLTTIICKALTPPSASSGSFYGCDDAILHVPAAAVSTYRETYPWSEFKNIQGI